MKVYIYIFLISIPIYSFAQQGNLVSIVDKRTGDKVPFPSITFITENYSINADSKGQFILPDLIKKTDTLYVSKQGYVTLKIPVNSIANSGVIKLDEKPLVSVVKTINLQKLGKEELILNSYDKKKVFYFVGLDKLIEQFDYLQIAQKMHIPESGAVIKQISITRLILKDDWLKDNTPVTRTKFILRIYDVDSLSGGPGKDLCDKIIEVSDNESETININVAKYKILVPQKNFFVAVEWLRTPYNVQGAKVNDKNSYGWYYGEKRSTKIYQPFIGMSNIKGQDLNCWALNFKNQWRPYSYFSPDLTDFAITASVNY